MVSAGQLHGGERAVARCDLLGVAPYSDSEHGMFRAWLSPAHAATQDAIAAWMADAGMRVRRDAAGNLIGRYDGMSDGPPLIIGSHIDSVRDAGRYDGPLGVMLGIECVAALAADRLRMRFPIEVYAFGDEEGSRFPAAMLTSRAVAGTLDPATLAIADAGGVALADALADRGLTTQRFAEARHGGALAYLEAHIEQGPVLEARGLALGTVTGVSAQHRYGLTVTGRAGHAGTSSMALRRDALTAAAAMILAAEEIARAGPPDLVATVGTIAARPGAANVVPGEVRFTIDLRAAADAARDAAGAAILTRCRAIADDRGVGLAHELLFTLAASPCDPGLTDLLDEAVAETGQARFRLASGAGHDAMVMAALCPIAMLFIRCAEGLSHHPDEAVDPADCAAALAAMLGFIERLEETARG